LNMSLVWIRFLRFLASLLVLYSPACHRLEVATFGFSPIALMPCWAGWDSVRSGLLLWCSVQWVIRDSHSIGTRILHYDAYGLSRVVY